MISFAFRRAAACAFALGAVVPLGLCQKSFVFPHALERDGRLVAIGWDLTGGQKQFRWIVDSQGPIVEISYAPIGALYSLYGNTDVFNLISASLEGKASGYSYTLYSTQKGARSIGLASEVSVSEVVLPECDVDSKEPKGVTVLFNPKEYTITKLANIDPSTAYTVAKKQKLWTPSSFRLSIGALPCSKVKKVSDIHIRPPNNNPHPDMSRFETEIPLSEAAAFSEALAKSISGGPIEYPLRLDYLDDEGNVLITLESFVELISIDQVDPLDAFDPADPANADKPMLLRWQQAGIGHTVVIKKVG